MPFVQIWESKQYEKSISFLRFIPYIIMDKKQTGDEYMFSYYSKLSSEVYDIDKYIGLSFGDVEFYSERLDSCAGPVLEPGVGTGRILIPLLEKGSCQSQLRAQAQVL